MKHNPIHSDMRYNTMQLIGTSSFPVERSKKLAWISENSKKVLVASMEDKIGTILGKVNVLLV